MTYYINTAETGLSDATDLTPTNSGNGSAGRALASVSAGSGGSIKTDNDRKAKGSSSYLCTPASGVTNYVIIDDSSGTGTFSASADFFFDGSPAAVGTWLQVLGYTTGTICQVNMTTSRTLAATNAAGSAVSGMTTAALSTGKWYTVVVSGNISAGTLQLDVYEGTATAGPASTATAFASVSGTGVTLNTNSSAAGRFVAGKFTAGANMSSYSLDNIQINFGSATPLKPYDPATATVTASLGGSPAHIARSDGTGADTFTITLTGANTSGTVTYALKIEKCATSDFASGVTVVQDGTTYQSSNVFTYTPTEVCYWRFTPYMQMV